MPAVQCCALLCGSTTLPSLPCLSPAHPHHPSLKINPLPLHFHLFFLFFSHKGRKNFRPSKRRTLSCHLQSSSSVPIHSSTDSIQVSRTLPTLVYRGICNFAEDQSTYDLHTPLLNSPPVLTDAYTVLDFGTKHLHANSRQNAQRSHDISSGHAGPPALPQDWRLSTGPLHQPQRDPRWQAP
jgi:hypothetical protein